MTAFYSTEIKYDTYDTSVEILVSNTSGRRHQRGKSAAKILFKYMYVTTDTYVK